MTKSSLLPTHKTLTKEELQLLERINKHLIFRETTACYEYSSTTKRYTDKVKDQTPTIQLSHDKFSTVAKVMFELFYCPVPKGKRIRHTCGNKRCVSPFHLTMSLHPVEMKALPASVQEALKGRQISHAYNYNAAPRYDHNRVKAIK